MKETAEKMGFALKIHRDIPTYSSPFYADRIRKCNNLLNRITVAAIWSSRLKYIYNPNVNTLHFHLSALQQWLTDMSTRFLHEDMKSAPAYEELIDSFKAIVPFALINHLLWQFKLRHSSNDLTPIVICEDCNGMCKQ